MIMAVYLNITCATPSKKRSTGAPRSPTRVSAIPKSVANTTTGRMSPFDACSITLEGNAWSAISHPVFGVASTVCASAVMCSPSPGRSQLAMPRPRKSAIVVTTSK